jgi:hypothetical protein
MRQNRVSTWRLVLLGCWVLGGAGVSIAPGATLRWKFAPGDTIRYEMQQKTTTGIKPATGKGQELKQAMTQTMQLTWKVKTVSADGSARIAQTIDRVQSKAETIFGMFEYDTKAGKAPEGPVAASVVPVALYQALIGAEFTFTMSPHGDLSDVKVPESVLKAVRAAGPAGGAGGEAFSEEGLKQMITQSSFALPKDDLAPGQTWTRQTKLPSPPIGTTVMDKTYRFDGPDLKAGANVDKITLTFKVSIEPALEEKDKPNPVEVVSQDNSGDFFFDQAAGRIVRSRVHEIVATKFTAMGIPLLQSLDSSTSMTLVGK